MEFGTIVEHRAPQNGVQYLLGAVSYRRTYTRGDLKLRVSQSRVLELRLATRGSFHRCWELRPSAEMINFTAVR